MKLEELAGALKDIKEQLFTSIIDKAAPEANDALLSELRERIMQGAKRNRPVSKPVTPQKQLNEQQSKFLKNVPASKTAASGVTPDAIQVEKGGNSYTIGIDNSQPQYIKDLATVTDSDLQQYRHTITEETKNQLGKLL